MNDRFAALGVEQDQIVVVNGRQRIARAHQHRQAEAAGENRAVRIRAAGAADHAEQAVAGELRHVARRDAVGDQDFTDSCGELTFFRAGLPLQRGDHPVDHLLDVFFAAAQVGIVHRLEHGGQTIALFFQRRARTVMADAHHVVQPAQQLAVIQQQAVRVDEFVDLTCQRTVQFAAQFAQLLPRGIQRTMQQFNLFLDLVFGQRSGVDAVAARLHQACATQRHAVCSDRAAEDMPHGAALAARGTGTRAARTPKAARRASGEAASNGEWGTLSIKKERGSFG